MDYAAEEAMFQELDDIDNAEADGEQTEVVMEEYVDREGKIQTRPVVRIKRKRYYIYT